MPTYRFQCVSCGLNFQARTAPDIATTKCECGAAAGRDLPRGVNIALAGGANHMGPTTTGFSGVDYHEDRAIGEYSKNTWEKIAQRQQDKRDLIDATGASGFDLTRNPDGTYRVMDPQERRASERSRNFHFNVMKHAPKKPA